MQKYFDSFPYTNFFVSEDGGDLFFVRDSQEGKFLHRLRLIGTPDLEKAALVFDQDLNSRSFVMRSFDSDKNILYAFADENHDEKYNLYQLDLNTKVLEKRTDVDYAAASLLSKDRRQFYFGDRKIRPDRSLHTVFKHLDLASGEIRTLFSDEGWENRMGWAHPVLLNDPNFVIAPVHYKNLRHRANLAMVDLRSGKCRLLLGPEMESMHLRFALEVEHEGKVYFHGSHSGHENIYSLDLKTEKIAAVTEFTSRNHGLKMMEMAGELFVVAVFPEPAKSRSRIVVLDCQTGQAREHLIAQSCHLLEHQKDIWIHLSQMSDLPSLCRLNFKTLEPELVFVASTGKKEDLVHSTHEFLKYPSFDQLEIPAYLALPANGPPKAAIVRAFYGGSDEYRFADQILLEQGIAVLSPAVRGSWGWGKQWENHLKGDLGGKEILDVVWGAKFLEKKLNLSPAQIGLEGGSHGGYAVLRAMTMPQNYLGQDSKYPWAFGLCWAGFADLVRFHEDSWISDWLTDLLGTYSENAAAYRDRSPLTHFDQLESPLFVVHGTHDQRVPTSTMTAFLEKLQASQKPHQIHFVEGQGHTGGDRKDRSKRFEAQQEFLNRFLWKIEQQELHVGGLYEHYKGMRYRVHGSVRHSETLEELVLYETLYENKLGKIWVRPKQMFLESIEIQGKKTPRFRYLGRQA